MRLYIRIFFVLLFCISLFVLGSCNDNTLNSVLQAPTGSGFWGNTDVDSSNTDPWNADLTPNINITVIGGNNKEDTIIDKLGDDSDTYDIVYQNVAFTLETVGFSTDTAIAVDVDGEEGETSLGLMYYYEDLNLFSTDEFYAAGFYEILSDDETSNNFEKTETLVIQRMGKARSAESVYLACYDYQDISYDHFVFNNKYVVYYQESDNVIRYIEKDNVKDNYDLTLGSLYDYDNKRYIYDETIYGEYKNKSGISLFGEENYNELEKNLTELSDQQLKNGYIVSEFNIVYISPESIQAYISSEEEETFFGYNVNDLTSTFGLGVALTYNGTGFEKAQIIPDDSYNWKPFLIKCGIGCGIIIVGAVLTPVTGGASFGCALVTISKYAIGSALAEGVGTLAIETVVGLVQGQTFEDALNGATHKGLDSFANGFMIGAAIGSVGVVTGLIKPTACFVEGTKVALGNGKYENIEDITIGDYVLSYNEFDKATSTQQVIDISSKYENTTLKLTIGGSIIETTLNHPFYSPKYNAYSNHQQYFQYLSL